jgi:membrane-associated protease RseP (regulator of RpoE activity)
MGWIFFVVVTFAAFGMVQAIYVLVQTTVGWLAGATVEAVAVGCGPNAFEKTIRGVSWRVGAIPWGGYTKFFGQDDEQSPEADAIVSTRSPDKVSFQDLPILGRAATLLVGALSSAFIGLVCVAVPIWAGSDQVVVNEKLPMQLGKTGVPYLTVDQCASTWIGQEQLLTNTFVEFSFRSLTFKSLKGWGGYVAWLSTLGSAGVNSPSAWLSCFGVTMIGIGVANLLPIPILNGGHIVLLLTQAVFGKLPPRYLSAMHLFGLLFLLLMFGRMVLADISWLFAG